MYSGTLLYDHFVTTVTLLLRPLVLSHSDYTATQASLCVHHLYLYLYLYVLIKVLNFLRNIFLHFECLLKNSYLQVQSFVQSVMKSDPNPLITWPPS